MAADSDTQPRILGSTLWTHQGRSSLRGHGQAKLAATLTLASSFPFSDLSIKVGPYGRTLGLALPRPMQRPGGDQARTRQTRSQGPSQPEVPAPPGSMAKGWGVALCLRFDKEQDFPGRMMRLLGG